MHLRTTRGRCNSKSGRIRKGKVMAFHDISTSTWNDSPVRSHYIGQCAVPCLNRNGHKSITYAWRLVPCFLYWLRLGTRVRFKNDWGHLGSYGLRSLALTPLGPIKTLLCDVICWGLILTCAHTGVPGDRYENRLASVLSFAHINGGNLTFH